MDDNTFKLLSLVIGLISTMGLAVIGMLTAQANSHAQVAAVAAQDIARVQERSTETLQKTAESTHSLVNGAMIGQLGTTADLAKKVADLTGKPEDAAVAQVALEKLTHHIENVTSTQTRGLILPTSKPQDVNIVDSSTVPVIIKKE